MEELTITQFGLVNALQGIRKYYQKNKFMEERVYWITSNYASQFDSLKVKEGSKDLPEEEDHMKHCLWFQNKEDAEELLVEIKKTIKEFYKAKGLDADCPIK